MKAFLFGAGSTVGTLPKCYPLPAAANQFGKAISDIAGWQNEFPALARVADHLGQPLAELSLERVWSCIDFYAKLQDALPPRTWTSESPDLKRALLRLYGASCDAAVKGLPNDTTFTLGSLFRNDVQPGDILVSFNYDTVIERVAGRFGHRVRMFCSSIDASAVWLTKPHGSTSWCMDLNSCSLRYVEPDGGPILSSLAESEVLQRREPLLLGAVPIKSELISEVQDAFGFGVIFRTVVLQWRAVVAAFRDSQIIIVVGYSFPREDLYGRFLMREGLRVRRRLGMNTPAVEFYELERRKSDTEDSIRDVLGDSSCSVVYKGPVTSPAAAEP